MEFKVGDIVRNIRHYDDDHWPINYVYKIEQISADKTLMGKTKIGWSGGLQPYSVVLVKKGKKPKFHKQEKYEKTKEKQQKINGKSPKCKTHFNHE